MAKIGQLDPKEINGDEELSEFFNVRSLVIYKSFFDYTHIKSFFFFFSLSFLEFNWHIFNLFVLMQKLHAQADWQLKKVL